MINYQENSIWKSTLEQQPEPDAFSEEREFLRVEFKNIREKAKLLAGEIASVLPEFTVHDISHIDALWDMAEIILPKDFDINPAEVFVLGCAFLLHDLGMALAAYPKGMEELKKEQIWQDTVTALRKEFSDKSNTNVVVDEKDIEKMATEKTLRLLHAKRAKDLAKVSWKNSNNQETFLIDNEEIRNSFGYIIGLIAYSHCLRVDELEDKLQSISGASSRFPTKWTVDSVKLACILRLADAMQIDDRRAPSFLKSIRNLSPFSEKYWRFQEKLYKPTIKDNRVMFTSKEPFSINEIDAWWECFDTLKMVDHEIKQVDALLMRSRNRSLGIFGVYSIDDTKELSKLIRVNDWEPVDVKIKVVDVARLVSSIGGRQLYGDNPIVPLRELIQNSSDAIRARRIIDDKNNSYDGNICVHIGKDEEGDYLEVEDNGIGMSEKVLVGPFLDFGQSFWGTDLMHEEFPGLESKGYKSTGKYGIGFFSLFMWGDKVSVFTNRYDKGRKDTLVLEFNKGTVSRPVLRKAKPEEYICNGGTRVKVRLKETIINDITYFSYEENKKLSLAEVVEKLCPSMNCNIWVMDGDEYKKVIVANDWITIPADKFLKRVLGERSYNYIKAFSKNNNNYDITENITVIKDQNHETIGRAALFHDINIKGIVTVGGFRTSALSGLIGIFVGESERASRDVGIPVIQNEDICCFVDDQIKKLRKQKINGDIQIKIARICRALTEQTGHLKITEYKDGFLSYNEIQEYVNNHKYEAYLFVSGELVNSMNIEEKKLLKNICSYDMFWSSNNIPAILQATNNSLIWPKRNIYESRINNYSLKELVIEAIAKAWHCEIDDLYKSSKESKANVFLNRIDDISSFEKMLIENIDIIKRPQKA